MEKPAEEIQKNAHSAAVARALLIFDYRYPSLLAKKSCVCEATKPPRIPLKLQSKIALLYLVDSRAPRDALAPWRAPRDISTRVRSFVTFIVGENRGTCVCFSKKEKKTKKKKI